MLGVFLDSETINQNDLDFSILTSTLAKWHLFDKTFKHEVDARIQDATVIVTNKVPITAANLEQASKLKCICVAATGCDHIDLVAAKKMGIPVCNVVGYSTQSVIQHTIGLLIALASKLAAYHQLVMQGAWVNAKHFCLQNYQTTELATKVLGIVGWGAIGQGVAQVASTLGMKVLVAQRQGQEDPQRLPLTELLKKVDVLSLHCPLTEQTRNLIGEKELRLMKPGAILLNVSRGGLVDEKALAESLLSGHLGAAGLDVSTKEPPLEDSPLLSRTIPNLILTPHVAWSTLEARKRLLVELSDNVQAFVKGHPRNRVG